MLLYHFAINANVCTICTCTVNKVNLNLLICVAKKFGVNRGWVGGGGGGKNGANKWTNYKNYKNLLYAVLVGKPFHLTTNIHSRAIFVLEKGGVLLLGSVLLLGHIRYIYLSSVILDYV